MAIQLGELRNAEKFAAYVVRSVIGSQILDNMLKEDLTQAALIGLWEASTRLQTTDRNKGMNYMFTRAKGAVQDELRRQHWGNRNNVVHTRSFDFLQTLQQEALENKYPRIAQDASWENDALNKMLVDEETPEDMAILWESIERIDEMKLKEKEKVIWENWHLDTPRSGVKGVNPSCELLGVSEGRVSQIAGGMKKKIRKVIES